MQIAKLFIFHFSQLQRQSSSAFPEPKRPSGHGISSTAPYAWLLQNSPNTVDGKQCGQGELVCGCFIALTSFKLNFWIAQTPNQN